MFCFNQARRTDRNHVFLNFVSTLTITEPIKLEETVRNMVMRYGNRLWKGRILQAELKMNVRSVTPHIVTYRGPDYMENDK